MSRVAGTTCGWETGDATEIGSLVASASATFTVVTATPTPASGTYCGKAALNATGGQYAVRSVGLGANKTDLWVRVRLYNGLTGADTTLVTVHSLVRLIDSAGTLGSQLALDASTGTLRAYRGGNALGTTSSLGGTLLGSAGTTLGAGWNLVEIHVVPTTGATGTFEIWLNGAQVYNGTSIQTSAGLANVLTVQVGLARFATGGASSGSYVGLDDVGINDTAGSLNNGRPGDYRIGYFVPDGAGASSQWTPSAGSNYQCVDDTGDLSGGTADYVSTNTTAQVDDYTVTNLPAGTSTIPVVIALAYASNPAAGVTQLKVGLISGATTSAGTAQSPGGASYVYLREQFETDPNTSAAWTATNVNAAKLRLESA